MFFFLKVAVVEQNNCILKTLIAEARFCSDGSPKKVKCKHCKQLISHHGTASKSSIGYIFCDNFVFELEALFECDHIRMDVFQCLSFNVAELS